jgi:hypothetical protein
LPPSRPPDLSLFSHRPPKNGREASPTTSSNGFWPHLQRSGVGKEVSNASLLFPPTPTPTPTPHPHSHPPQLYFTIPAPPTPNRAWSLKALLRRASGQTCTRRRKGTHRSDPPRQARPVHHDSVNFLTESVKIRSNFTGRSKNFPRKEQSDEFRRHSWRGG